MKIMAAARQTRQSPQSSTFIRLGCMNPLTMMYCRLFDKRLAYDGSTLAINDQEGSGEHVKATTLAQRLERLFDVKRPPGTPALTNDAAAEQITALTGEKISGSYIWQLRSGLKTNPTYRHIKAIAHFFGVPPSYLVDDDESNAQIDSELILLQAMRDTGVRNIAMRLSGLTPRALENVAGMIDHVRALEHLPPVEEAESDKDDHGRKGP